MSWRRALKIGAVGVLSACILTGGCGVSNEQLVTGKATLSIGGVNCTLQAEPTTREFHVPLVLHYYGTGSPFVLNVDFVDRQLQSSRAEVTQLILHYPNRPPIQHQVNWSGEFKIQTSYHGSRPDGSLYTRKFLSCGGSLGIELPDTSLVDIEIVGRLQRVDGKVLPFRDITGLSLSVGNKVQVIPYWLLVYIERHYKT